MEIAPNKSDLAYLEFIKQQDTAERHKLLDLVQEFATAMTSKLLYKHEQGYRGWDDPKQIPYLEKKLVTHVGRLLDGDLYQAVDIANIAAFIWSSRE